ncbi:Protein very KIND [Bagarius yarrelli]|uniref:Protein very KIND n=1 Tax=Bagarius yarrelli TaxID=175774 RepID=A0A556TMP3_BAGYA|nr:Protein very KIND [Bagarius yarrelli]
MESFAGDEANLGDEEDTEEEEKGKVKALPPLFEDEENVSLADILCLRDSCLSEQEVWAVCAECVLSLQSISCSSLFYTLCITPDTLAFNAHGNVCFMEQLNDDPEGSFIPPEYDKTGNTFEGHVFSLGSTLSAALGYDLEPKTEAILSLAEAKITDTTTTAVCRKLSAIGRRVLSIESVAPFQDEWEKSYHHFMDYKGSRASSVENHAYDPRMARHYSTDSHDEDEHLIKQRQRVCNGSFRSGSVDGYYSGPMVFRDVNNFCPSQNSSSVLRMNQDVRWRRSQSALNRSCSIPDSNNPRVFSCPSHTNLSMMVADLSDIGGEESIMMQWEKHMLKEKHKKSATNEESVNRISNNSGCQVKNDVLKEEDPELVACVDEEIKNNNLRCLNHMTKSLLCLKEEFQDEVCIYGVAAILWATAKFHLSPNQKLAMPRKLKRLLLEMARKTPIERPSVVMAKKSCRDYLSHQGTDPETVWTHLINRLHKASNRINEEEPFPDVDSFDNTASPERKTGFIPLGHDVRLAPVSGPLPQSSSFSMTSRLPEAFTSSATHFTPIVVSQEDAREEESPIPQKVIGSSPSKIEIGNEDLNAETPELQDNWMQGEEEDHCFSLSSSTSVPTSSPHTNLPIAYPELNSQCLPTYQEVSCPVGVYNNFLLQQDPQSGRLTLFPVHIAVSQPITGLDLSLPLRADSETDSGAQNTEHDVYCVTKNGESDEQFISSNLKTSKGNILNNRDHLNITDSSQHTRKLSTIWQPILQQVIGLIREEFAFNSYLENGPEELVMGEYIVSLTSLQFDTFCSAITEKFSDLHWDKDLLGLLHCLVNQDCFFLASVEDPLSALPDARRGEGEMGGNTEHSQLSHETNKCHTLEKHENKATRQHNEVETNDKREQIITDRKGEKANAMRNMPEDTQSVTFKKCHPNYSAVLNRLGVNVEKGGSSCPVDGAEMCACCDESLCQHSDLGKSTDTQLSLDCSDAEMDDSNSVISDRTVFSYSGFQGPLSRPTWALALYGVGFFSQKVVKYAYKLGSHTDSPSLEDKAQELHQQLVIESRDLKKTRNFYHKLIQQEKKNKDQWGLPLSLLPSLASSGSSTIDLRATEDPTILSLVCEQHRTRGGCPLLAGTPKGLMAFLYSRANKDFSTDSAKVYHRTLDLLECWIVDSRSMDFTNSHLQTIIVDFLTSKVASVDSRGESLLMMLQNSPKKIQGYEMSNLGEISFSEWKDLDVHSIQSFCRKSSVDDAARKWRVPRVVEPQVNQSKEKVYSIALALPRPCYSSLLGQLSRVSVRNEERLAFSQTEHSPLNIAQQLTLLQQETFQGCHPVHFLNSRAQGVKEKPGSISKCLLSESPTLEGSSLFVGDEPVCDGPLRHLLRYAESISNWVSAEIVITDSVKVQTALLGKFLAIAKHCYEARNFATAMQILGGLENVIVKQLPAWRQLSAKMSDVLEEIRAVQVFLKSDSLCLMEGERGRRQPTLPDAHILAMHVQQLEIGAFTLTNKAVKWTKLRSIARVVSQVHAFQEHMYTYTPDLELQSYLQARISRLGLCDVSLLASDNDANFNQPSADRHTRRIQNTLRRVKASFQ